MRKFKLKSLKRRLCSLSVAVLCLLTIAIGVCSCKAWRTVTTTATYVQSSDSTKLSQTITTKTVEEYQGVKKR